MKADLSLWASLLVIIFWFRNPSGYAFPVFSNYFRFGNPFSYVFMCFVGGLEVIHSTFRFTCPGNRICFR